MTQYQTSASSPTASLGGMQDTLRKLVTLSRQGHWTLGFAESCTGGLLSAEIAKVAGISDVFQGSIVSYSYQAKVDLLGVSWDELKANGAVSEKVAKAMAQGACRCLKSDWSVAVTGIAGPSGGLPDKPVGTVWFSVHGPDLAKANPATEGSTWAEKKFFQGDRNAIQLQSAQFAASFLVQRMESVLEIRK